jgi:chorismate mutase
MPPPARNEIKELTRKALEDGLDQESVTLIVDHLIREAKPGSQEAIASLMKQQRYSMSPATPNEIKKLTRKALEDGLDQESVTLIVDHLIREAKTGNQESIGSLLRLLDFQRSVACW